MIMPFKFWETRSKGSYMLDFLPVNCMLPATLNTRDSSESLKSKTYILGKVPKRTLNNFRIIP